MSKRIALIAQVYNIPITNNRATADCILRALEG